MYNLPMKTVTDTNIFLAVILDEPEKAQIIDLTVDRDLLAPEILPFEIGNALTALMKRKSLTPTELPLLWKVAREIPVELTAVDINEALIIAGRYNIYAYDAYFLQCALYHRSPLLTLDKRLKEIARDLGIKIVE